ncbi:SUMF1/EgtB/PvdO family nonheme iron enzyme [Engelhardtia mirabilis]
MGSETILKLFLPRDWLRPDRIDRDSERRAHKRLADCRGVVRCRASGTITISSIATTYHALVLDRVDGQGLAEAIVDEAHDLQTRLRWFESIATAVFDLHDRAGFVHLDLKPENVCLVDRGLPRVLDLGLARSSHVEIRAKAAEPLGSIGYGAPEQFPINDDSPSIDKAADLFALGQLLVTLVRRKALYPGPMDAQAYARWLREGLASALERLPQEFVDCGSTAELAMAARANLSIDPAGRPHNADDLRRAVERSLDPLLGHTSTTSSGPRDPDADAQRTRLELVRLETERADLLQIVTEQEASRIVLEDVYVQLSLIETAREHDARANDLIQALQESGGAAAPLAKMTLDEALADHRRILVVGGAGSGKTTLLRRRARALLDGASNPSATLEPILVRLRDLDHVPLPPADQRPGQPATLLQWIAAWHAEELRRRRLTEDHALTAAHLAQLVDRDAVLLLLDGFDELSRERQTEFAQLFDEWARDGFAGYQSAGDSSTAPSRSPSVTASEAGARVVLSSRPNSLPTSNDDERSFEGFVRAEVQDLDGELRQKLARRLFAHIGGSAGKGGGAFIERLADDGPPEFSELRSLASTPVMLTLLVLVHLARGADLPSRRVLLYHEAVDELIRRFLRRRDPALAGWNGAMVRSCLTRIAWRTQCQEDEKASAWNATRNVEAWIAEWLEEVRGLAPVAARAAAPDLLELFHERSGLLVEPENPTQRFVHRSIGEFLAATALAERERDEVEQTLEEHLADPHWENTLQMAAALLADPSLGARGNARRLGQILDRAVFGAVSGPGAEQGPTPSPAPADLNRVRGLAPILSELRVLELGPGLLESLRARRNGHLCAWAEDPRFAIADRVAAGDALGLLGPPTDAEEPGGDLRLRGERRWVAVGGEPKLEIQRWPVLVGEYARFLAACGPRSPQGSHALRSAARAAEGWPFDDEADRKLALEGLRKLAREGKVDEPGNWSRQLRGPSNLPVAEVNWIEAVAYCAWLGSLEREAGWVVMLPTEKLWERAARAGRPAPSEADQDYPWRSDFNSERANTKEGGLERTTPVGVFVGGHTADGAWDMAGNVWEWTLTQFDERYGSVNRVMRGGSFANPAGHARCGSRVIGLRSVRPRYFGFRAARTITP